MKKATFGAGCFWGVEMSFMQMEGVLNTKVGYMGGELDNPSYEDVCSDRTGHAEVVYIEYDESKIDYEKLVRHFFEMHDPTQIDRQGPDVGTQYRSVIFFYDDNQKSTAQKVKNELEASDKFNDYIATIIEPAKEFWPAEEYHQKYLIKNKTASCSIFGNNKH